MNEGSGYCGSGGGIESVPDAAKIANMVPQSIFSWSCFVALLKFSILFLNFCA